MVVDTRYDAFQDGFRCLKTLKFNGPIDRIEVGKWLTYVYVVLRLMRLVDHEKV